MHDDVITTLLNNVFQITITHDLIIIKIKHPSLYDEGCFMNFHIKNKSADYSFLFNSLSSFTSVGFGI